jgi:AcrR family transcriptional regulator
MNLSKRQIEIIEAATILIGEKGIQNLTTKNLAAKMGFSEPALYRHFKGKTEILKCVLIYYKEKMGEGLKRVLQSDLNGLEKIKGMIDFQFSHFAKYPAVVMVIFAETSFQYDSVLSQVVAEIMVQKRATVTNMISSGQKDGTIRKDIEANQLATIVMGSMRFTLLGWRLSDFDFNLVDEGEKLWGTINVLVRR